MARLTITIPTYNRSNSLSTTLASLLSCNLPDDVEIFVIDNCSDSSPELSMPEGLGREALKVRWIRNAANLGLAGNILRCFEHGHAPWIWLLGDDDPPQADAVDAVLAEIDKAGESDILLKFSSANGTIDRAAVVETTADLGRRCLEAGFYSNLLFISSGVYRRSSMLMELNSGYHWASSVAPHIAMLVAGMARGGTVRLVPRELVHHGRPERAMRWSPFRVAGGFPSLLDQEVGTEFGNIAGSSLAKSYLGPNWLLHEVANHLVPRGREVRQWRAYYNRLGTAIGGLQGFVVCLVAWASSILAKVKPFCSAAARLLPAERSPENLERS